MRTSNLLFLNRLWPITCGVVLASFAGLAMAQTATTTSQPPIVAPGDTSAGLCPMAELPDSPGTTLSKPQAVTVEPGDFDQPLNPTATTQVLAQAVTQDQQHASPPQPSPNPLSPTQKPVGTAAAGSIPAGGVAASQPAGVAIAPAKQHRVRTIVLRMGAIIGAGVAVGTVVALTEATPSKPPGAH